jgi:hypothetical protein
VHSDRNLEQQQPLTARSQPSFLAGIPNEQEDLTKLMREALTCKEHARVLQSALAHVKPSKLDSDPIIKVRTCDRSRWIGCRSNLYIQEFYATCVRDQESMVSQMGWANAQAEKARENRGLSSAGHDAGFEAQMDNLNMSDDGPSFPERVFLEVLAASDELSQVRVERLLA